MAILSLKRTRTGEPDRLVLRCAHEENDIAKAAGRGTARWQQKEKVWTFPVEPVIYKDLLEGFYDLQLSADLESYMTSLQEHQTRVRKATTIQAPLYPGDTLWPFQRASIRFLEAVRRGILGHEMGTGKTVIVSAATHALALCKIVVVCPNSVKWSWVDHLIAWGHWDNSWFPLPTLLESGILSKQAVKRAPCRVIHGPAQTRMDLLEELLRTQTKYALIMNYDQVKAYKSLLQLVDHDLLVLDEAHRIKNRKALRTQTVFGIAKRFHYVWALTGTPLRNDWSDLWALLHLCDPKRFGSFWSFVSVFLKTVERPWGATEIVGVREQTEFNRMLSCYMFRKTKKEVIPDLPDIIYKDVKLPLNPQQAAVYKKMERELIASIRREIADGKEIEEILQAPNVISQIIRLRQICLTPALFGGVPDSAKLDALYEIIEDLMGGNHKCIIYTMFAQWVGYIETVLNKLKVPYATITGADSAAARKKAEDDLKTGAIRCIVGTIQSMGEGMNLQAADTAIATDQSYVPAENRQAEGRIHRGGIKKAPTVIRMIHPDTIEEDIMAVNRRKEKISDDTVGQVEMLRRLLLRKEGVLSGPID